MKCNNSQVDPIKHIGAALVKQIRQFLEGCLNFVVYFNVKIQWYLKVSVNHNVHVKIIIIFAKRVYQNLCYLKWKTMQIQ